MIDLAWPYLEEEAVCTSEMTQHRRNSYDDLRCLQHLLLRLNSLILYGIVVVCLYSYGITLLYGLARGRGSNEKNLRIQKFPAEPKSNWSSQIVVVFN
jgi:hypothetical protein